MSPDDLERLAVRCLHAVKDADLHSFDNAVFDEAVVETARLAALREVLRDASLYTRAEVEAACQALMDRTIQHLREGQ